MFDRLTARCRATGLHVVKTRRLWVISARLADLAQHGAIGGDDEARHWQGWSPEDVGPLPDGPVVAPPSDHTDVVTPLLDLLLFTAVERRTRIAVAAITTSRTPEGNHLIGGNVRAGFRNRGYGREALTAACVLAHRHFGITTLYAGCETSNLASRDWLAACGFTSDGTTSPLTLPNGREVESVWWWRTDHRARVRCPHLHTAHLPADPGLPRPATRPAASPTPAHRSHGPRARSIDHEVRGGDTPSNTPTSS